MNADRPVSVGSPHHELIRPIPRTQKARLVIEILGTYLRVRWLVWRRDLPRAVASLRGPTTGNTDLHSQAVGARLGQAVDRTLSLVPFDSRCLVRSLVLTGMLARRGISSTLVIGVSVEPSFAAHAWVESGGRALLPPLDGPARLVEL